jgi:hypothetical protein
VYPPETSEDDDDDDDEDEWGTGLFQGLSSWSASMISMPNRRMIF